MTGAASMQAEAGRDASVLARSQPSQVSEEPFPHIVVDGAIDPAGYAELAAAFPAPDRFMQGLHKIASNQAVRIPASVVLQGTEFSPAWREFFAYHTSAAFWADIVRVFSDNIRRLHPDLESRSGKPLGQWRVRRRGSPGESEVELDVLFVINTPVTVQSSVRAAHIDSEEKIFAGLLYMRADDDDTPGGDLGLYSFGERPPRFAGSYAPESAITETKRIDYCPNRFIGFLNSPVSVHGVTPRPVTAHVRRYLNFVAVTPYAVFERKHVPFTRQALHYLHRKWDAVRTRRSKGVDLKE